MSATEIQISLEISLIILGLYLAFFKSYFQEKGKNIATQEDIGKITSTVESIKTDFIRETEKLKIDLSFSKQFQLSLKNEKSRTIIECYENYSLWLDEILNANFLFIRNNDELWLQQSIMKLKEYHSNFKKSIVNLNFSLIISEILLH